ncbi:MAG: low molecular weight phosphotyrosine protein phosphatase [Mangrovicoccus sp.]|nr:low molecular weight phosphotyrosine protein phosphatase [Mangrovicoccus sp.]
MASRILFVCLGNICRSPTADGVLRQLAPDLQVDSAGTGDWHVGEPPYGPMQRAAAKRGYDLSPLRARQVEAADFTRFDRIYAMDGANLAHLEAMRPASAGAELSLLLDLLPDQPQRDVPDPYYTRDFDQTLDLVEAACAVLRDELCQK